MTIHRPARAFLGALAAAIAIITVIFDQPLTTSGWVLAAFLGITAASLLRQSVIPKPTRL